MNTIELERYKRHFSLFGLEGQEKISKASILIVGCGGVGSPVALYLAAAGIGVIGIVDDDVVDLSNLQRQILFAERDINHQKVDCAKTRLESLNSNINIKSYADKLTLTNAASILSEYDLVIDGTDNFQTRYLVNDICCQLDKPFISASVLKDQAQLAFFNIIDGCYRCIFPSPPPKSLVPNCAEAGVLGSVVGVVGTLAVTMALNFIVKGQYPLNELKFFDSHDLSLKSLKVNKNRDCPSCVHKQLSLEHQESDEDNSNDIIKYSQDLNLSDYFVIDVREGWERQVSKIDNDDLHLAMSQVLSNLDLIPKNADVLIYCHLGVRSLHIAEALRDYGYKAYSLDGGIEAWDVIRPKG